MFFFKSPFVIFSYTCIEREKKLDQRNHQSRLVHNNLPQKTYKLVYKSNLYNKLYYNKFSIDKIEKDKHEYYTIELYIIY